LQSISGVNAINPLVAFYDIHGGTKEVLFFYFVPDTTRDPFMSRKSLCQLIIPILELDLKPQVALILQDMPRVAMSDSGPVRGRHPVLMDHRAPRRRRGEADAARQGPPLRVRAGRPRERRQR
jgi:hypothetical protein